MITIRDATIADYPTFARLFLELKVDDPVLSVDRFESEMLGTTLVAENDGAPVGYAYFRPFQSSTHLSHIVTAPEARRTGAGRALMAEVKKRAKALGCSMLTLNVKPENKAAIALYRSFGLDVAYTSRALRIDWAIIDELPHEKAPFATLAKNIEPSDDARLEDATRIATGLLAEQRARPNRVLRMIEAPGSPPALAVFDQVFPGAYPLRAPAPPHVFSLLRALRPHARLEDTFINLMIEDQADIAEALVAEGAQLRMEALHMRGPT